MMAQTADVENHFARDGSEKFGKAWIIAACKRKILPDQDAERVASVVEGVLLVDTATPDSIVKITLGLQIWGLRRPA